MNTHTGAHTCTQGHTRGRDTPARQMNRCTNAKRAPEMGRLPLLPLPLGVYQLARSFAPRHRHRRRRHHRWSRSSTGNRARAACHARRPPLLPPSPTALCLHCTNSFCTHTLSLSLSASPSLSLPLSLSLSSVLLWQLVPGNVSTSTNQTLLSLTQQHPLNPFYAYL